MALAVLLGVAMAVQLWRSRHAESGPWTRADSLTVLGLLVALVGIVVPALTSERSSAEDPAIQSYRQDVSAACRALAATTNPLMDAFESGGFDRDKLWEGLNNQTGAAEGVLEGLWRTTVPEELETDARGARTAAGVYLSTARQAFDRMKETQPRQMSFQEVSVATGRIDVEMRPALGQMESAMSRLAGQPCMPMGGSPNS